MSDKVEDAEVISVEPAPQKVEIEPKTNAQTRACGFTDKQLTDLSNAMGLRVPAAQLRQAFFQVFPDVPADFVYDDAGVKTLLVELQKKQKIISDFKREKAEASSLASDYVDALALLLKQSNLEPPQIIHLIKSAAALLAGVDITKLAARLRGWSEGK